jgi:hypothetical protein
MNEQKINDQILHLEQDRKVSQLHNMSFLSHLSIDPAAVVQASMMQHLEMSQFIDTSKMTDDRAQILQWHINQIQIAKEQVDEA